MEVLCAIASLVHGAGKIKPVAKGKLLRDWQSDIDAPTSFCKAAFLRPLKQVSNAVEFLAIIHALQKR